MPSQDLQDLQDLHRKVANILAVPSVYAYARVLSLVEDHAKRAAAASTDLADPDLVQTLNSCRTYHSLCSRVMAQLAARDSASERAEYERRRSKGGSASARASGGASAPASPSRKRGGVELEVYSGEYVVAALEALKLGEFLEGRGREPGVSVSVGMNMDMDKRKKVRFTC
ncbi:hypothetical protein F5B17DRAFT_430736 [Nemania serpens]|nr:hypothetical protein F5B17DRAFT_430736 [Nemania serpens]